MIGGFVLTVEKYKDKNKSIDCPNCGIELSDDTNVCNNCGKRLSDEDAEGVKEMLFDRYEKIKYNVFEKIQEPNMEGSEKDWMSGSEAPHEPSPYIHEPQQEELVSKSYDEI